MNQHRISIIAAIGRNKELGKDNKLLWEIPLDMKRFREKTKGHPVIMGRKTFESIGMPLPKRTNIIVTRNPKDTLQKFSGTVQGVSSIEEAIEIAKESPGADEIFIIGGAEIYRQALGYADRLYMTVVDEDFTGADAFFPEYENEFEKVLSKEYYEDNGYRFEFVDLERE